MNYYGVKLKVLFWGGFSGNGENTLWANKLLSLLVFKGTALG